MREDSPYRVTGTKIKKRVRMVAVSKDPLEIVNRVTGEVTQASPYVGKRQFRDVGEFIKIYDPLGLAQLKSYEAKVFYYALSKLDFDGLFVFETDECMEQTGLKRTSVFGGLGGLVEKDFIRRDKRGCYWVNPNIAFRGSRDDLLVL